MSEPRPAPTAGGGILEAAAFFAPVFSYTLVLPLKGIFLYAVPWLATSIYACLSLVLRYAWLALRLLCRPLTYPLEMLVWRPGMAVLFFIYQNRHIFYFVTAAVLFGSLLGLASYYLTARKSSKTSPQSRKSAHAIAPLRQSDKKSSAKMRKDFSTPPAEKAPITTPRYSDAPMDALDAVQVDKKPLKTKISESDRFEEAMRGLAARKKQARFQ